VQLGYLEIVRINKKKKTNLYYIFHEALLFILVLLLSFFWQRHNAFASYVIGPFPADFTHNIQKELIVVERKIQSCPHIPWKLRKKMLRKIQQETIYLLKGDEFNIPEDGEHGVCAYVHLKSYVPYFGQNDIYFTDYLIAKPHSCFGIANKIFHELIHLSSFSMSEENVSDLEMKCLGTR
jgi:hypothetical protein